MSLITSMNQSINDMNQSINDIHQSINDMHQSMNNITTNITDKTNIFESINNNLNKIGQNIDYLKFHKTKELENQNTQSQDKGNINQLVVEPSTVTLEHLLTNADDRMTVIVPSIFRSNYSWHNRFNYCRLCGNTSHDCSDNTLKMLICMPSSLQSANPNINTSSCVDVYKGSACNLCYRHFGINTNNFNQMGISYEQFLNNLRTNQEYSYQQNNDQIQKLGITVHNMKQLNNEQNTASINNWRIQVNRDSTNYIIRWKHMSFNIVFQWVPDHYLCWQIIGIEYESPNVSGELKRSGSSLIINEDSDNYNSSDEQSEINGAAQIDVPANIENAVSEKKLEESNVSFEELFTEEFIMPEVDPSVDLMFQEIESDLIAKKLKKSNNLTSSTNSNN